MFSFTGLTHLSAGHGQPDRRSCLLCAERVRDRAGWLAVAVAVRRCGPCTTHACGQPTRARALVFLQASTYCTCCAALAS